MTRRVGVDPSNVRGDDIAAWQRLDVESPAVAVALRSAVVALCATLAVDAVVVSLALVSAARVWLGLDDDDRAGVAYAARRAVRFARQDAARIAATDPDAGVIVVDHSDPDVRLRLDRWESRPDGIALESGAELLREAFGALLDRLDAEEIRAGASPVVRPVWEEIAATWLAHSPRDCARCEAGNGSRVTLANVRAHVAGIPVDSAAWKRGKRSDGRIVALVSDALAALVAPRGWEVGAVFPLVYGEAWRAVERGDSRDYSVPVPVERSARERITLDRSRALVSGPLDVRAYGVPCDALGYPSWLGYAPLDANGYDSALGYGALWARPVERARRSVSLVSERVIRTGALAAPDTGVVRVGGGARLMSEAEVSALAPVRTTRPAPFAGEFAERVSSAPIGERDRRDDGQVRSFKPVVSPRKKAPANGPSVPAQGMTR